MNIPKNLDKEGLKYILLGKGQKIPLEQNWQKENNYTIEDPKLQEHLKKGLNYGVLCGGGLIVIDADTQRFNNIIIKEFPETFTVKTSKGFHYYYFTLGFDQKKVLKDSEGHLGEIQNTGSFVVGANCIHPSGDIYKIIKDISITQIDKEFIEDKIGSYFSSERIGKEIIVNGAGSGLRNDSMFKLACSFREKELNEQEVFTTLLGINSKNNPPLSEIEIKKIVESAFRYKKKETIKQNFSEVLKITNYYHNTQIFFNKQPFIYDENKIFWFWNCNEYKWEIVDEIDLLNSIDDSLDFEGETINPKIKTNYLDAFKRIGRKNKPIEAPARWIQFKDKAFSLRSKNIYKVEPNYFFTNPIKWEIGESDKTPIMDKLFAEWVGEKYVTDLYELISYCCYRDYPIQSLICLYGAGRNGKSSFLKVLDKFFGNENITSTELDLITGFGSSRFETFKLYKKLVCLMGETNFGTMEKSSMLKKLVGGDKIGFEVKNKTPFTEYNYAKIIIASNSLPSSNDESEGFYRRWHIIDFPNEFPEGKDITLSIPNQEYKNLARKVVKLLPGLIEKGHFSNQGTIPERKDKYIMASNPLPFFIKKYCIKDPTAFVNSSEVYAAYVKYLLKHKKRKVKMKEFRNALENEGLYVTRTSKRENPEAPFVVAYWIDGLRISDKFYADYAVYTGFST